MDCSFADREGSWRPLMVRASFYLEALPNAPTAQGGAMGLRPLPWSDSYVLVVLDQQSVRRPTVLRRLPALLPPYTSPQLAIQ